MKGYKYKVLILIDHNNIYLFMDTKCLSFCQVWWAYKLAQYHFWIDYCQRKANGAANKLSRFLQSNQAEEKELQIKNTQILHKL